MSEDIRDQINALEGLRRSDGWSALVEQMKTKRENALKQITNPGTSAQDWREMSAEVRVFEWVLGWPDNQIARLEKRRENNGGNAE